MPFSSEIVLYSGLLQTLPCHSSYRGKGFFVRNILLSYNLLFFCLFSFFSLTAQEEECIDPIQLTLGTAIERALAENRQLANVYQTAEQSEFGVILNKGEFDLAIIPSGDAGYVGGGKAGSGPTVGAGVEFYKKFVLGTEISIQPRVIKAAHAFTSQLNCSIRQPLLRNNSRIENLASLRAAEYSQRSALRTLLSAQINTVLRTIQALYDVKRQEEALALDKETYNRLKHFWESSKRKEKIGLCDSMDLYRAEIEYKNAENNLAQSLDRLQDVHDALKDILAYPLNIPIEVEVPITYHPITLSQDEAIAIALQYRQEVYQAWDQLQESRRLACVAKERIWPDISLVLDFSSNGCEETFTQAFCRRRESRWGIGIASSTDLDRTADKIAFQNSLYAIDSAERGYAQVRDNVELEVKRVLRGFESTLVKMQNYEEQIKSAQGGLYLAKIKYERGLGNNFDVIQAEKTLKSAQASKIGVMIEHIVGEYKLLAALGILGSVDNISICTR